MVALRLCTLLLLAASFALPARADVFPYEAETAYGRNNIPDSNATSCDSVEGCYTRTGARCSANPNVQCDLQIVPLGRCTNGNLATGLNSCVWPHGAGRCASNTKVGCLTDAYQANPANTATGPSAMCSSLATNTCDMATDPFGGTFRTACTCQGTDSAAAAFETTICGGSISICSDGDALRDTGGFGTALGVELLTGAVGTQSFATMGPSTTGSGQPTSTPYYAIENPPTVFDPQRNAGTVGRSNAGPIHDARTTDAREITDFLPALGVRKIQAYGDSYWNDWAFSTVQTTGTFNTHIVVFSCDPPVGWSTDVPVGGGLYCSQAGRDGVQFVWSRDLTAGELAANTTCPPNCKKDYDLSTTELQAFVAAGLLDGDAGAQLAIQSGEGRQAGAGDSLGVAVVTSITWLVDGDLRCRMGGWGNPAGQAGRCADGPNSCDLAAPGTWVTACAGQGGTCRACNGPYNAGTNPLGLPIGYNTHGRTELDLTLRERIGGIAGQAGDVAVPLFVVGTSGHAAADFRDLPSEGGSAFDLADMGQVIDPALGGSPWATGVGTGGTFTNPSTLPIGEACCANGANITWAAAALGDAENEDAFPYGGFLRLYDVGPGPNGIPGCIGDNAQINNGATACDQRLGQGTTGNKTDGFFATGQDDHVIEYTISGNSTPATTARFQARAADAPTASYFSTTYGTTSNPPTVNSVAAYTARDLAVFIPKNTDVLFKVSTTQCPIIGQNAACATGGPPVGCGAGNDTDGDTICNAVDNCVTVANLDQADTDVDAVGNVCDSCTARSNPRVAAGFLTTNPWATLTGDQRDDDHDGFGNKCDAKFPGVAGALVGSADLTQFRASNGKNRTIDTCGTLGTRPCAIFDLDEASLLIGTPDLNQFRLLNGKAPGPKCTTCPLTCTAGASGSCL